MTRRARLGGAFLDRNLTPLVLAPLHHPGPPRAPWRRITAPRVTLALLALAIAFAVGAVRPRLSAGLAWPCGIAAAGLVVNALAVLFSGQAIGADEAAHLVAVAGSALLAWQSWTAGRTTADPADRSRDGRGEPAPERPGGTAAQVTGTDIAARAGFPDGGSRHESVA